MQNVAAMRYHLKCKLYIAQLVTTATLMMTKPAAIGHVDSGDHNTE